MVEGLTMTPDPRRWLRPVVAAVQDGQWHWGLGDPDTGAVLVTALYLLTSLACLFTARSLPRHSPEAKFWYALFAIVLLLGINKQADLQSLLTLFGRDLLRNAGVYDQRRTIQIVFIAGVAFAAWCSALMVIWWARSWFRASRTAAVGLCLQLAFIVVRAASFHRVDIVLGLRLGDLKVNLLLESVGLSLILLSALRRQHLAGIKR